MFQIIANALFKQCFNRQRFATTLYLDDFILSEFH